jgi:general secretion pathway protein A
MYNAFFGVSKSPFAMSPDPAFLYLTPQHREALSGLTYAVLERKGFLVLTGGAGTGKTTMLGRVLKHLPPNRIQASVILNPVLSANEFLEMVLLNFGVARVPASKAQRLILLRDLLATADRAGRISALIVDEAHKLSPEVLEEIRLLGNEEQADHKMLQILFLGQEELVDVLNRADMRQLKQRIAARFTIGPLAASEVGDYLRYRWMKAGGSGLPFPVESVAAVAHCSGGIPRLINAICDNALLHAFSGESRQVMVAHIHAACSDLDIAVPGGVTAPPAPVPVASAAPAAIEEAPLPFSGPMLGTLERYGRPRTGSFWGRWVGRLGHAN